MSQELSQALLDSQVIKHVDIEEALQRQVLYGGSIGTNLLEGGAINEDTLLQGIGKTYALPTAGKAEIDRIGAHIPRLFPQVFAESYHMVPLELQGDVLNVLVTGNPDVALLQRVHERLQLTISAHATSEVRLHYAMNQLYGSELLPRFRSLISLLDGVTVVQEPGAAGGASPLSWGVSSARVSEANRRRQPKLNLREMLARLEFAPDRDAIVEILLSAASSFFDYSALFLVQGQHVNGWRGTNPEATQRIARLSLPVELPSVFQTIYATQGHYLGPLPRNSVNAKFIEELGREPPRAAFVAPMIIGGRLAMILYNDNGDRAISPRKVAAVLVLMQRVSLAFERLIRKQKTDATRPATAPVRTWTEESPIEFDLADEEANRPGDQVHEVSEHEFEVVAEGKLADVASIEAAAEQVRAEGGARGDDDTWEDVSFSDVDETPVASADAYRAALATHGGTTPDRDSDYVAFADVEDTAEENLDGWGDVLIEAAGLDDGQAAATVAASPAKPRPSGATVSWTDVINEALAASKYVTPAGASVEVAGTVIDETELLFDGLVATDGQIRRDAIEKLLKLGGAVDGYIMQRFPGHVTFNPFDAAAKVPSFAECSGLLELILARGASAAPLVLPFLDDEDSAKRFFAIYFLLAVRTPEALESLARRLYDTEPRNRHLAADALRGYNQEPAYPRVLAAVRANLKVPVLESQFAAVQLLGQLRDPASVPELIPLVAATDNRLSRAAASALAVVCAHDYGQDVTTWSEWWKANYNQPRPVWLIQGLRHQNPSVRRIANYELQLLTGMTTHFVADASHDEREERVAMWENWWLHVSRAQAQKTAAPQRPATIPPPLPAG